MNTAAPASSNRVAQSKALSDFLLRLEAHVKRYLSARSDGDEQNDHLRHVADRTRWLYFSELQRTQGKEITQSISRHDSELIDACVLSHDMGKWVSREELRAFAPEDEAAFLPIVRELRLLPNQIELLLLGIRRRLALAEDGYTAEYDAAHHLVSAFALVADPELQFHQLELADQERLIDMIIGHQFGSYFKERLFQISLRDDTVTTGILVDISRPERVAGDVLACAFHDADISDLLYVGSLERRPNREDILHSGGLIKILLINFNLLAFAVPDGPRTLEECLQSCQFTVTTASREFMTVTAMANGVKWRQRATTFLDYLREPESIARFEALLHDQSKPPQERVRALRLLTSLRAREFLRRTEGQH